MNLAYPRDTCQMIISGTDSFRLGHRKVLSSTRDTEFNNFGGNRANVEKGMREVWQAEPGYLLVQPDQSGAEALIVAYLTKAGKYRALFLNSIKPHTYLAFKLFPNVWREYFTDAEVKECLKAAIEELKTLASWKAIAELVAESDNWPGNKRFYHLGKKIAHASAYGMKANTFKNNVMKESGGTIMLDHKEASRLLAGFHIEFPEIQQWHLSIYHQLEKHHQLRNLLGYPYNVTTHLNPNDYKDFIAWIPQSTVACITRQAYVRMFDFIEDEKPHWHLLADTHDSYCGEAPGIISADGTEVAGEALECGRKMKSFLEIELVSPTDGTKFRMKSSCSIGYNWAPRKEKKDKQGNIISVVNPLGLREVKL